MCCLSLRGSYLLGMNQNVIDWMTFQLFSGFESKCDRLDDFP